MRNILIGKVIEKQKGNEIIYDLNFYNGKIKKNFKSKSDLLDFISIETKALFDLNQNNIAAIKYCNVNKFDHFFVFRKVDNQILVGEQSKFEYQDAQSYFGKKIKNKRLINERHFDFMDIVRGASNFKSISMWIKLIIIFMSLVVSVVVWVDILDILNDKTRPHSKIDIVPYQYISLVNAVISLIVFITSIISIYFSLKIISTDNDADKINDFRRVSITRQRFRKLNLLLQMISIGLIIRLIIVSYDSGYFESFNSISVLISINMIISFLAILTQISIIFIISFNTYRLFSKYYPHLKYSAFLKWYKKRGVQDEVGSIDIFILDNDESLKFYNMEIDSLKKIKNKDTLREVRMLAKNSKLKKKNAIKMRVNQLKKEAM